MSAGRACAADKASLPHSHREGPRHPSCGHTPPHGALLTEDDRQVAMIPVQRQRGFSAPDRATASIYYCCTTLGYAQRTRRDTKNIHVKAATAPRPVDEFSAERRRPALTENQVKAGGRRRQEAEGSRRRQRFAQ